MHFLTYTALLACASTSLAWNVDNHPSGLTKRDHPRAFRHAKAAWSVGVLSPSRERRWLCNPYNNPKGKCDGGNQGGDTTDPKTHRVHPLEKKRAQAQSESQVQPVVQQQAKKGDADPAVSGGKRTTAVPKLEKGRRGVNLGSYLLFEPWISQDEWDNTLGCKGSKSEYDCGKALGQEGVNAAFEKHWQTFYTKQDINDMKNAGLNTIRVPVGHWIYKETVNEGEIFPEVRLKSRPHPPLHSSF